MKNILHYQFDEAFRVLGEPTRIAIMRLLLSKPATISQIGASLDKHPAQIKYHITQLEKIGLVELAYEKTIRNYTEKYYRSTSNAVFLNKAIFPEPSEKGQIVILGGDGPALELLVFTVNKAIGAEVFCHIPAGSLDSLIYLRENYCQIAGCHLFDYESGDFNVSYIRHLFSLKNMTIVTFGHRNQGLLFRDEFAGKISSLRDVVKNNLTFVNRELGTATRLRLEKLMAEEKISASDLKGYDNEVQTYTEIGEKITNGRADVGLGMESIARQMDLGFHFLFTERYDLVMAADTSDLPYVKMLIETLRSEDFCRQIEALGGYDMSHAGEITNL
jgi:putative molybdopterin biosynthesis protein